MKKLLLMNIIIILLFFILDPILSLCVELADTYNLGAELALGLMTPLLFAVFVFIALCSIICSVYNACREKNIKHLVPTLVLVIGALVYILVSNNGSFWVELISYYLNI